MNLQTKCSNNCVIKDYDVIHRALKTAFDSIDIKKDSIEELFIECHTCKEEMKLFDLEFIACD